MSELAARIEKLEAENAALRSEAETARAAGATEAAGAAPRRRRQRGRTATAIVLVVVGLILSPVAVISAWARLELVDTDRFVATFAPLADEPAVQAYLADEVTAVIEEQVDIAALTSDIFDGLQQLDLPPRAQQALALLEAPATQGLQSLVSSVVDRLVQSDAFADIWATALRASHRAFVAAVEDDPGGALAISGDGTVSVELGPIVEAVKDRLEQQGVGFASAIPVVDRSIEVVQSDAFVLVETVYALAVAAGTWLPLICLALMVAGVLVAPRRIVALMWTSAGLALSMAIMASGVGIGRLYFVSAVSPSIMPASTARALYGGLVELMLNTIVAIFVLAVLVAVIAWFSGPWRPARAMRRWATSGFAAIRRAGASYGVTTGSFGIALDKWRSAAYLLIALVAAAVVLFNRPVTIGLVVSTVLIALLAVLLVELLRRPADEVAAAEASHTLEAGAAASAIATSDAATKPLVGAAVAGGGVAGPTAEPADAPDSAGRTG